MANNLTSNPILIDTASGSTLTGLYQIQQIQWIDDNADIVSTDDLNFTLNGVTVNIRVKRDNTAASIDWNGILYNAGPFAKPILARDFVVNAVDNGAVLIWLA